MRISVGATLRDAASQFVDDKCPRLAAALSYYTLLSLAPMLFLVLTVASLVFEQGAARDGLLRQVESNAGPDIAELLEGSLEAVGQGAQNAIGAIVAFGLLLVAATTVLGELQAALNQVWGLQAPRGKPWLRILRERAFSALVVILLGVTLVVSLAANAVLAVLAEHGSATGWAALVPALDFTVSVTLLTLLIAAIYKILPDAAIGWRHVLGGALFTSILLAIGKLGIAIYLGRSAAGSSYGAAGAVAALLVWVYLASLIFLFGAEMTEIHAAKRESIKPRRGAIRVHPQRIPLATDATRP